MELRIKDVTFHYSHVKALENVTFEVKERELLGIIGPNGSGKTTLLRCINNSLKPKLGTILIDEQDVSKLNRKEIARRMGLVPQDSIISIPFSVLDVVLMGREPHMDRFAEETKNDLEIAEKMMKLTGCFHLAERKINQLSGGERRRVIVARALTQEPNIMLLDEPTLHLDVNYQLEICDLIRRITTQSNLITIMTTHNLNIAARYCDRLILLHKGKIYRTGSVTEVLTPDIFREVYHIEAKVSYNTLIKSHNIILISAVKEDYLGLTK